MGLVDTLRRAEEQARKAARASVQRTIVGLDDAERAIRRRMRVYPKQMPLMKARTATPPVSIPPAESQAAAAPEIKRRKAS
mgnify:CR=1 FL=1